MICFLLQAPEDAEDIRREVSAMTMVKDHHSIISIHDVIEDERVSTYRL